MIKKLIISGIPIFLLMLASSAMAMGIGVYGTAGGGSTSWSTGGSKTSSSSTNSIYGGGLLIDTAVAKDTLFNYRLNIGFEKLRPDFGSGTTADSALNRISLINTFGFGVVRTENIRFWVGPQLGLRYGFYKQSYTDIDIFYMIPVKYEEKLNSFGADLGLALGLNVNLGSVVTLGVEGGVRYGFMTGPGEVTTTFRAYPIKESKNITLHGLEGYVSLAFIFRINDTFASK